jgi:hypothetical protein
MGSPELNTPSNTPCESATAAKGVIGTLHWLSLDNGMQHLCLFSVFGWLLFSFSPVKLVQTRPRGQARWKRRWSAFLESQARARQLQVGQTEDAGL